MEWDEACGTVWEALATARNSLSAQDLSDQGIETNDVRTALSRLQNAGLVTKISATPRPVYNAVIHLDALHWAKAVEMGVSIDRLERLARLDSAGRSQALEMASNGELENAKRNAQEEKARRRQEYLAGEAASRVAATDLARLLDDTQQAIDRLRTGQATLSFKDRAAAVALEQAHREASSALESLVKNFQQQ